MFYIVPGLLAGVVFYFLVAAVGWVGQAITKRKPGLRGHRRLVIHCLATAGFLVFLALNGGGGNWATNLQVSGFLIAGCLLSLLPSAADTTDQLDRSSFTDS